MYPRTEINDFSAKNRLLLGNKGPSYEQPK